jgi:hypothetical protein
MVLSARTWVDTTVESKLCVLPDSTKLLVAAEGGKVAIINVTRATKANVKLRFIAVPDA